jgi:hypothetical protein
MTTGRINQVTILPGGGGKGGVNPPTPPGPAELPRPAQCRPRAEVSSKSTGERGSTPRVPASRRRAPSRELTRWRRNADAGPRCGHLPVTFLKFPFTGVRRGRVREQLSPQPSRSMAGSGGACAPAVTSRGTVTAGRLAPSALGGVLTSGHQSTKPTCAR